MYQHVLSVEAQDRVNAGAEATRDEALAAMVAKIVAASGDGAALDTEALIQAIRTETEATRSAIVEAAAADLVVIAQSLPPVDNGGA
jgi:hypothetical protein